MNEIFFFQLAKVSCIFLTLFFPLLVVLVRPEAYVAESARKNIFTIDIFLNAFQKLPVSALGDRNPLFNNTTGTEQTSATSHFSYHLSDLNWRPAGVGSVVHSVFHLPSETPNKAMMLPLEVYFLTLEEQQCSPRPLSVVW